MSTLHKKIMCCVDSGVAVFQNVKAAAGREWKMTGDTAKAAVGTRLLWENPLHCVILKGLIQQTTASHPHWETPSSTALYTQIEFLCWLYTLQGDVSRERAESGKSELNNPDF